MQEILWSGIASGMPSRMSPLSEACFEGRNRTLEQSHKCGATRSSHDKMCLVAGNMVLEAPRRCAAIKLEYRRNEFEHSVRVRLLAAPSNAPF